MSQQLLAALSTLASYAEASKDGLVPDGVYLARVEEVATDPKSDGRVFLKFTMNVVDGAHANRKIVKNILVADQAAGVLKGWIYALLGEAPATAPEIAALLPRCVGQTVKVRVRRATDGRTSVTPYA